MNSVKGEGEVGETYSTALNSAQAETSLNSAQAETILNWPKRRQGFIQE